MKPQTEAACYQAIEAVNRAYALLDHEAKEAVASDNPPELVRTYADLMEQADALRAAVALISKLENDLSYNRIPACFDAAGIKNVNVVGYGLVALTRRWSCSMLDKAKGFAYLRMHDQGGMIIETVPAPTLGAWAREETEEKGREPPDDIFKTSINRHVSLTRSKAVRPDLGSGK